MKQLVYTVTITVPQDHDDYDYTVQVGRDGMSVGRFTGTMLPATHQIGEIIMNNVEDNQ